MAASVGCISAPSALPTPHLLTHPRTTPFPLPLACRNWACPAPGNTLPCRFYTATGGDSLASIAMAFSLDLPSLQETNPDIGNDTVIILQPGEKVFIPPFTENCGEGALGCNGVGGWWW